MQDENWTNKIQKLLHGYKQDISKATIIGKKMITASQTSSHLKESYEKIGKLFVEGINKKEFEWDNIKMNELLKEISQHEEELQVIEKEVQDIKK